MNIKKTLLSALVASVALTVSAQDDQTEYVFQPNWYVQAQVGGQYTLGEIDFGSLISPTAQVGVGYNFNKVLGLRLSVNAWQSKAGIEGKYIGKYDAANGTFSPSYARKWKWNYVAPMIDINANLSNLFCGYNPKRVVNVGIFAGIGANIAWNNDEACAAKTSIDSEEGDKLVNDHGVQNLDYLWCGTKVRLAGKAGLNVDFRLSDAVSLGIEGSANLTGDRYNSKKAGNSDWYFNAMVGVKYNLGKTYTTRKKEVPEPQIVYKDRIVEKVVEKPVAQKVESTEPLRMDVFFNLASTKVVGSEEQKIQEVANYMKNHPSAKVSITGYADKGTGNAKINQGLSETRADIVKKQLIEKYGISADRITTDAKGDTVQPYDVEVLNRVSICIAK